MSWRTKKLRLPKGAMQFPDNAVDLPIETVVEMYHDNFVGIQYDPDAKEELMSMQPIPDGDIVAMQNNFAETGKGKLSIPFVYTYTQYPKVWPSFAQETGDCVSRAGKNTGLILLGVEAALGEPDEETGQIEGFPEVPLAEQSKGIICYENIYGDRGHRGQGASCSRLIIHVTKEGGLLLRKNYPEIGLDLTNPNTKLAISWGGKGTPDSVKKLAQNNLIRNAVDVPTHEVARDYIHNGYPIWSCSSLGWSDQCDENGYARRKGSWGHSWIVMGYDDRPETIQMYGFPLFLYCHDWGLWNSNKKGILIRGTNVLIPPGCFWADARLLDQCDMSALSGLRGWRRQVLPDYGGVNWG